MTAQDGFERRLTAWLEGQAPLGEPDGLLDAVNGRVARTGRLPGWAIPERWFPMTVTMRLAVVPRAVIALLLAALLASLMLAGGLLAGALRSDDPPQIGLPRNGLIAYSDRGDIWLVDEHGAQRQQLTTGPGDVGVVGEVGAWSPDGELLAFWKGGALWAIRFGEAEPRRLWSGPYPGSSVDDTCGRGLSWSPDSAAIAFTRLTDDGLGRQVDIVALDGSPSRMLVEHGRSPTWSPDGLTIAYLDHDYANRHGPRWAGAGISLIPAGGGVSRPLTHVSSSFFPGGCGFLEPQWSPDSRRLAFHLADEEREYSVWVANADGTGEALVAAGAWWPRWSPDGTRLAYGRLHMEGNISEGYLLASAGLVVSDPDGSDQVVIDHPLRVPDWVLWSPDGTRLVTIADDADGRTGGLLILDSTSVADPLLIPADGAYGPLAWQPVWP